jgi:hypothetical protein
MLLALPSSRKRGKLERTAWCAFFSSVPDPGAMFHAPSLLLCLLVALHNLPKMVHRQSEPMWVWLDWQHVRPDHVVAQNNRAGALARQ